jgi:hypothetical protein
MGLINLKTNLKGYGLINSPGLYISKGSVDLKFGQDEYEGGSSGQPFIQTRIPATDESLQTNISVNVNADASVNNLDQSLPNILGGAATGAVGGLLVGGAAGAAIGAGVGLGLGIAGAVAANDFSVGLKANASLKLPNAGTGGTDFLLRGGTLLPGIIANDAERLFKFFKSTDGVLFTVKQNLLSRIAVSTQASPNLLNSGIYTPISTLAQAIGNPFGLHVNKQGLNPFAGTGPTSDNERLYGVKVTPEQIQANNRLVNLWGAKITNNPNERDPDPIFLRNRENNISTDPLTLLSYGGGPNSFLGVGKTNIRLASNPIIKANPQSDIFDKNYLTWSYKSFARSQDITVTGTGDSAAFQQMIANGLTNGPIDLAGVEIETLSYELSNPRSVKEYIPSQFQQDFRSFLRLVIEKSARGNISTTLMSQGPSYAPKDNQTIEQRVSLGDPGNASGKNLWSYVNGYDDINTSFGAASNNSYDKINALPVYRSTSENKPSKYDDLVNFRIGIIDNTTPSTIDYIHFRAFLDQISDNYSSNWDPTKYIGRGENFYTYSGFDRKVSLGWTVAAQSKVELMPMYEKLNYLASICAPDYSSEGYMRGNIVQLTIGGYFYEQPGIITGLNYEMNSDNDTWEIAIGDDEFNPGKDRSVRQLPHIIRVTGFNFTPIHRFVPRKQQNLYKSDGAGNGSGIINTYGQERYIALADIGLATGETGYDAGGNGTALTDTELAESNINSKQTRVLAGFNGLTD